MQSLSVCGAVKLAGTSNGIYRLLNDSWEQVKPTTNSFIVVETHPTNCTQAVAGIWGDYVYETTDSGATWQQRRSGLPVEAAWNYGVAFAQGGDLVLLGTELHGVYEITNGSGGIQGNWQRRLALDKRVVRIAADQANAVAFVWEDGLYWRSQAGAWSRWAGPQPAADKTRGRALLLKPDGAPWIIGGSDFLLRNTGDWATTGPQVRTNDVIAFGNRLYAAQTGGVVRSANEGATWVPINTGFGNPLPMVRDVDVLHENGQDWLYAATTRGVWRYRLDP